MRVLALLSVYIPVFLMLGRSGRLLSCGRASDFIDQEAVVITFYPVFVLFAASVFFPGVCDNLSDGVMRWFLAH